MTVRFVQVIEGGQRLGIVGDLFQQLFVRFDGALGQPQLLLVDGGDAQAQVAEPALVAAIRNET